MPHFSIAAPIESLSVGCYVIPTDKPESDGTLEWHATTLVVLHLRAGGVDALGYGYADRATATLLEHRLIPLLQGRDALATHARHKDVIEGIRNLGRPGICSMALSIVDIALWDFKARFLEIPLATLLGQVRREIPIYGSGGFTSYSIAELEAQVGDWARQGLRQVKMKVGRDPENDLERVRAAAASVGDDVQLFVDANGAYQCKQALRLAEHFAGLGVTWFEEPVSSDDLSGLRLLRDRGPAGMAITAGEYGYDLAYFRRMLEAQAIDVLQADATRCGGITGFLGAATLCAAFHVPLSSHCAPSLHVALCCCADPVVHLEYFHDHVRIEERLFDGVPVATSGCLAPALDRPGLGLTLKHRDAARFAVT